MKRHIATLLGHIVSIPLVLLWYAMGWRGEGEMPDTDKIMVLGYPHTSNWDYVLMIFLSAYFRRRPRTMIKSEAVKWPLLGTFIRLVGGIPIDRSKSSNTVDQVVNVVEESERILLAVTPEGTRSKTEHWRSGFYHIARKADLPVVLGYLDYERKVAGMGPAIHLSGDMEADMARIREFYEELGHGRHPEKSAPVRLADRSQKQPEPTR